MDEVMARARKEVDLKSELQIMKRKELDELRRLVRLKEKRQIAR